jgi:hypothetical protein
MPALRASRIARTPLTSVRTSASAAAPDDLALRRDEAARQRGLEPRQAATREQRVVAVDLREQRLLRRHREHLLDRHREHLGARANLALDLGLDLGGRLHVVPQPVDLVEDHEPSRARRLVGAGEVVLPDVEVGLGDAGVRREDEQHRVRGRRQGQGQLGLGADRVEARRVEDHEALLQKRVREVDDRVAPARDVDAAHVAVLERRDQVLVVQAVAARERDRHALDLRDARERVGHALGGREVERQRHPLVRVALELGDGAVLEARLDRQQADRRRPRRIVQDLGRAHRRAPGGRRQEPRAEVGEEDRVDELGLAARELGDERDDELVLVEPLEQPLHAKIDLRVGEVLVGEPVVQRRDAGRQAPAPVAVRFEAGCKLAGVDHPLPQPKSRPRPPGGRRLCHTGREARLVPPGTDGGGRTPLQVWQRGQ